MDTHAKIFLLLTIAATSCLCQLVCYDCDPIKDKLEDCKYPKNNTDIIVPRCEQIPNTTQLCLSSYIKDTVNSSQSGIYRGCVNKPYDVDDTCEWLKENTTQSFMSCHVCNVNKCNHILLNPDGSSTSNAIYNYSSSLFIALMVVYQLLH